MESDVASLKLIRSRRAAREAALRSLFQSDVAEVTPGDAIAHVLSEVNFHPETSQLVRQLTLGVETELGNLDDLIRPHLAKGWSLERLAIVDRCLLRMAAYELWHMPTIPPKVTANEAVALAKRYGDESSSKFVNGVIGSLIQESPKATWLVNGPPDAESETGSADDAEMMPEVLPPVEEKEVEETDSELQSLARIGTWTLKREEPEA